MSAFIRRGALPALLALVLLAAVPAAALALDAPSLRVTHVAWSTRAIDVSVTYGAGASEIALTVNGSEASRTVAAPDGGTAVFTVRPTKQLDLHAIAYPLEGTPTVSPLLRVLPSVFRPASISSGLVVNKVLGPRLSGRGKADPKRTTRIFVMVRGKVVWRGSVAMTSQGRFSLPRVKLPAGRPTVKIGAANAWGTRWSRAIPVYNLGANTPKSKTFLMVDKSTCTLYHVRGRVMARIYPCAVGMPGTPTPQGYFKLGAPHAAGGPWGVLRMRLSRVIGGHLVGTSYYIHGTNAPSSIGTWASHGCIRMYNRDVRKLAASVRPGYTVYIRY